MRRITSPGTVVVLLVLFLAAFALPSAQTSREREEEGGGDTIACHNDYFAACFDGEFCFSTRNELDCCNYCYYIMWPYDDFCTWCGGIVV